MNTLYRLLDEILLLNRFCDIYGERIVEGDKIRIDYRETGKVVRDGADLWIQFKDWEMPLESAERLFRLDKC